MAELEPGAEKNDLKEDVELGDEGEYPLDSHLRSRVNIYNITGTVFRAHRYGIYISFIYEGKQEIGVLFPGKSFVNGSRLLGDVVKTDQELSILFHPGMIVHADLVSQLSRLVPESTPAIGSKVEEKNEEKKCGWVIMYLWFTGIDNKPDKVKLMNGSEFLEEESSFSESLDVLNCLVMDEGSEPMDASSREVSSNKWFVTTILMPRPNTSIDHPDSADFKGVSGTIEYIHEPHGGIVNCGGTRVYFHRSRVFIQGVHLSITIDLRKVLQLKMKVTVDYTPNEADQGPIFENCPAPYLALLLYVGDKPPIPHIRHTPFPLSEDECNRYLVAKIVQFDLPAAGQTSGVESGIAEILKPTDLNTLAFTKNSFKRYVDVESPVHYVRFHRDHLFHLGALLHKADLQFFFSACAFGMNIFYCYAAPIDGPLAGTLFHDGVQVTHEVTLGWKGSVSFLHATGQGGLTLTPNTREDTLLYPRVFSFQSTKFLGREGMDIGLYEDIVEGRIESRAKFFNGYSTVIQEDYVCARIHDILPPQGNSGVSSGIAFLESGQHAGQKALFDRKVCSAFGWSLERTDLQYLFDLNEPCFVSLEAIPDSDDVEIRLRVTNLWLGWPKEHGSYTHPRDIPVDERHKLLLFLESHNLTIKDFITILAGERNPRIFIPFRKDEMKGTVVQLDRGSKFRGIGLKEQRQGRDAGAVSGVVKVDKGPLIGSLVTFHRRNTWVLGYNMGKADLTNLFIEGQKVSLEAVVISADDRKKYPGLPYQYKYRATLVWTSKFRPRNDIEKTVPESVHVNNWLKKRGLSWDKFQLLVKGKLPIVPAEIATRHRTNMLRGGELEALVGPMESQEPGNNQCPGGPANQERIQPRLDTLPVFRHGPEAVRLCDEALSVLGPSDPRIYRIIQSDHNAQMAFHIHKALGFALEEYKNLTGRVNSGNYSGFGDVFRSGPTLALDGAGLWGNGAGGGGTGPGPLENGGLPGTISNQAGSSIQLPFNFGGGYQQANQMVNRLQQMAMEERGNRIQQMAMEERGRRKDDPNNRRRGGNGNWTADDDKRRVNIGLNNGPDVREGAGNEVAVRGRRDVWEHDSFGSVKGERGGVAGAAAISGVVWQRDSEGRDSSRGSQGSSGGFVVGGGGNGTKRQHNNQGGNNRGKKNRGGNGR